MKSITFLAAVLWSSVALADLHIHCRVDTTQSKMSDTQVDKALERAASIWKPHGIELVFNREAGCTKSATSRDLHVHLMHSPRSNALGYSNSAACNTVRDLGSGSPESCGSVIAHEIAHCFGLENVG